MNHSKQILWHIILISLMNAMTYIYFGTYIWLYTPLFCSCLLYTSDAADAQRYLQLFTILYNFHFYITLQNRQAN